MQLNIDLTKGGITTSLLRFTVPMIAGALLQQCYNIADTYFVGQLVDIARTVDGCRYSVFSAIRSRKT